jgi:exodeoxyribonuclease-1
MVLLVSDSAARPTFLFHDYETFGTHPALDRPAQFAAIRTDDEFNIIGEPEVFYCKPADDYLPQPGAVMVTGITLRKRGRKALTRQNSPAASTICLPSPIPAWSVTTTSASMTK